MFWHIVWELLGLHTGDIFSSFICVLFLLGQIEDTLQKVKIPLISNAECQSRYQDYRITDKMLCAGYAEGGKDACKVIAGYVLPSSQNWPWCQAE